MYVEMAKVFNNRTYIDATSNISLPEQGITVMYNETEEEPPKDEFYNHNLHPDDVYSLMIVKSD